MCEIYLFFILNLHIGKYRLIAGKAFSNLFNFQLDYISDIKQIIQTMCERSFLILKLHMGKYLLIAGKALPIW